MTAGILALCMEWSLNIEEAMLIVLIMNLRICFDIQYTKALYKSDVTYLLFNVSGTLNCYCNVVATSFLGPVDQVR